MKKNKKNLHIERRYNDLAYLGATAEQPIYFLGRFRKNKFLYFSKFNFIMF